MKKKEVLEQIDKLLADEVADDAVIVVRLGNSGEELGDDDLEAASGGARRFSRMKLDVGNLRNLKVTKMDKTRKMSLDVNVPMCW